jgi:hypothetical protein
VHLLGFPAEPDLELVGALGHVEELATALVTEADKARPKPLEDLPQPDKARPRPGVGDGGGTESRQVTQDDLVWPADTGDALAGIFERSRRITILGPAS